MRFACQCSTDKTKTVRGRKKAGTGRFQPGKKGRNLLRTGLPIEAAAEPDATNQNQKRGGGRFRNRNFCERGRSNPAACGAKIIYARDIDSLNMTRGEERTVSTRFLASKNEITHVETGNPGD